MLKQGTFINKKFYSMYTIAFVCDCFVGTPQSIVKKIDNIVKNFNNIVKKPTKTIDGGAVSLYN